MPRPTRWILFSTLLWFVGLSVFAQSSSADELVLVRDGESLAPIVLFADAPPRTRHAVGELADYIEKVSGARPEIIEGEPSPLPERAVWVGYQPVLDTLFPEQDFDFEHPEEILLAANDNHLAIVGRDRWDPDHMRVEGGSYKGRNTPLDGVQQEYGTANAIYTFLQDYLDVRWLWPGELGEDIIEKDTISFEPFEYRYHPQIRGRATIFNFSTLYSWRGHSHDWLRHQRLQLDSLRIMGGHPFSDWWDRFGETHPEYFALQPNGTRTWRNGRTIKLCVSNPAVWDQWLSDVEEALERNPNKLVFSAAANDGGYSGYCICENCRAWDHPDGQRVRYTWEGISQEYVAVTDRQIKFTNTLARMLKERYPDRDDLFVMGMSYGNSRPLPAEAKPDDNVIFSIVANFLNRPSAHPLGDSRELFLGWGEIAPHIAWRPNLGNDAGWGNGMPNVAPHRVMADVRLAAENNIMAMFLDMVWEHWANHGPHYYMLAQMAWNPYADGEAILADYYQRAFSPAAEPMTDYWTLMEESSDEIVFDGRELRSVWNDEFYAEAREYLDRAEQLASDGQAVYAKRIDFVRAGLNYMELFYANLALIDTMEEGRDNSEAMTVARDNWQRMVQILEDYPAAFNSLYVAPGRGRAEVANPDSQ